MKDLLYLLLSICLPLGLIGQSSDRPGDLPGINLRADIPSPSHFLGYPFGKWHVGPDQITAYARLVADLSDRVTIREYARSHEDRPLVLLTISHPSNQQKLEAIRLSHLASLQPASKETYRGPVILYQGFSIHGDEASGAHAAMLYLYYLSAGTDQAVEDLLRDAVILLDPCLNPDGLQRFSTWANMHRGDPASSSPFDRQHRQGWPSGRTNHYWFDLNRDWLPAVHPETRGRLAIFHDWKPHLVTDHHEMGPNGTFFFQPGVPSRVHPLIPEENQRLAARIGRVHAAALDTMGSLFYSREDFDDFYFGKGSTYPDAWGSIGILFEQASARGNVQDTEHGTLTFTQAIQNHLTVSRTSLEAAVRLRKDLQDYQVNFFRRNTKEIRKGGVAGFRIAPMTDQVKESSLMDFLAIHRIASQSTTTDPGAIYIPLDQPACRLVQSLFVPQKDFTDSLFYDISTWYLPSFYALDTKEISEDTWPAHMPLGGTPTPLQQDIRETQEALAWFIPNAEGHFGRLIHALHARNWTTSVATKPVVLPDGQSLRSGALMIRNQGIDPEVLLTICREHGIRPLPVNQGDLSPGPDLGSPVFKIMKAPRVGLLIGDGVHTYSAGEVWHHLQEHLGMPVILIDLSDWDDRVLEGINTLILPHGSYSMTRRLTDSISDWVKRGNTLLLMEDALAWARKAELIQYTQRTASDVESSQRPYDKQEADRRARTIKGISINTVMDRTHPLAFGFDRDTLPTFRLHGVYIDPLSNPYATPVRAIDDPLISGYLPRQHQALLAGSASVLAWRKGHGRIIGFADQVLFRGMTVGSRALFDNALFFSSILDPDTLQSAE